VVRRDGGSQVLSREDGEGSPAHSRSGSLAALGILILLIVAAIAFTQSYQRWLDPIIDTGRDLYIPEQIDHGARLYRDIRYQYPPLAPYALALVTGVVGHSLASYTAIGLLQSVVIAAALWLIGRRTAGTIAAFVAAMFFVSLSFCGATTWGANFLFPYSYGATIGMALIVASLALFIYDRSSLALVPLFFATWSKVEYAMAAAVIIVALAVIRRISLLQIAGFVAAEAVAAGLALWYFPNIRDNVFAESLTKGESARQFFRTVSGLGDWQDFATAAFLAIVAMVAIVWLLRSVRLTIAVPVVIVISFLLPMWPHAFFRAFGLLQFVALVIGYRRRNPTLVTLAAFSIATTLRVPLSVSPVWYGFALIVPTYALIAYVLFDFLQLGSRAVWLLPLAAFLCGHDLVEQHERYAQKRFAIESSRGKFYDVNPERAQALNALISQVHGGTLAVFPEGLTVNYLTESRTTLTFHTFTPVETAAPPVEDAIIRELLRSPPDRVVILTRDVREYGYQGFGIDYDRRLLAYLGAAYRLTARWVGQHFRMILLTRSP
jgi:hypothetical protein